MQLGHMELDPESLLDTNKNKPQNSPTRLAIVENQGQPPRQKSNSKCSIKKEKNHTNLYLATMNVKTLKGENKLRELREALSKIIWDVIRSKT